MNHPPICLTIGGSDSGGAAGIQADLKTWTRLGVYGMSAVTAVTAQSSVRVAGVMGVSAEFLALQIDTVLADYGTDAVKTGFIGRTDLIHAIADHLPPQPPVVVDPVLVDHRGTPLFDPAVVDAVRDRLLPRATLVTPNRREAALLSRLPVDSIDQAAAAADRLLALGAAAVLIKAVPQGDRLVDLLCTGDRPLALPVRRLETTNTHGSGDVLSAATAAYLAQGAELAAAVRRAQAFTARAIAGAVTWRLGRGHGPLDLTTPDGG